MDNAIEIPLRLPTGVSEIVGFSFEYFVGLLGDDSVLKYPHMDKDQDAYGRLSVEAKFYGVLQPDGKHHDRIVEFKGFDNRGICLEYAPNGTISKFLANMPAPQLRHQWSLQAAEGMAYFHERGVIHCDVNCNNLLLDEHLGVKYVDFQGRHYAPDGTMLLNGFSKESPKSYMPRKGNDANCKTDIFALGSAIYYMLTGEEPFPDLDTWDNEEEIALRWTTEQFPEHTLLGDVRPILVNCWSGAYLSASELVVELKDFIDKVSDPAE